MTFCYSVLAPCLGCIIEMWQLDLRYIAFSFTFNPSQRRNLSAAFSNGVKSVLNTKSTLPQIFHCCCWIIIWHVYSLCSWGLQFVIFWICTIFFVQFSDFISSSIMNLFISNSSFPSVSKAVNDTYQLRCIVLWECHVSILYAVIWKSPICLCSILPEATWA